MIKNFKIIYIEWIDSKGIGCTWEHKEDLESMPPVICYSVGFLLEETKEYITIAQSDSETQVLGRMTIPKICITKKEVIK